MTNDEIGKEIADIKKLLIFALIRSGSSQGEVAAALGINQSSISRMGVAPARARRRRKRQAR